MSEILDVEGIQITNVEEYEKKCNLVKKIIKSTYKNSQITFRQLNKIDLMYVILDKIVKILIIPDANWIKIKK